MPDLLGHRGFLGAFRRLVAVFLRALGALLRQRVGHFLRALDVEAQVLVVLELHPLNGEVLRVEGVARDGGDLHRELLHVEGRRAGARLGIDNPVLRARGGLPRVPELVRVAEPVRGQFGGEYHLGNAFGGKLRSQVVVGPLFRGVCALRGDTGKDSQEKD